MNDFNFSGTADLNDQIKRFANTYKYASEGKIDGLFSFVNEEYDEAYAEFVLWLSTEIVNEATNNV